MLAGLEPADNPLDFIKKNLGEPQPPAPVVQQISDQVAASKAAEDAAAAEAQKKLLEPPPADPMPTFGDEKKPDDAPADAAKEPAQTPEGEEPVEGEPADPTRENFKKLKGHLREVHQTLTAVKTEKDTLQKELEDYKTGAVVPEVLKNYEMRIQELERWEKLHNLKASREYTEKYVAPVQEKINKLKGIFTDYGVPETAVQGVLDAAVNKTNRAELNAFLSEHFDELGAMEAKQVITELQSIQKAAKDAEAEPAKMLEQMQKEAEQTAVIRESERVSKIQGSARESWVDALLEIRKEGKVMELIRKDHDPEFNSKFVDPIISQAAIEYGRFVSDLAKAGIAELPKPLAAVAAKAFLLAHATAIAIPSRNAALKELEATTSAASRINGFIRPQVGGGVSKGGASAPSPQVEETPTQAAAGLINRILSGR